MLAQQPFLQETPTWTRRMRVRTSASPGAACKGGVSSRVGGVPFNESQCRRRPSRSDRANYGKIVALDLRVSAHPD